MVQCTTPGGPKCVWAPLELGTQQEYIFVLKEKAVEHSESLKTLANGTSKTNTTLRVLGEGTTKKNLNKRVFSSD